MRRAYRWLLFLAPLRAVLYALAWPHLRMEQYRLRVIFEDDAL